MTQQSLGIHTEETRSERDTCTPMFIATLFIISRTWKQPRCPLADEWIRKLWYIYTMEYYSAIKSNETVPFAETWIGLETFIKSGLSQKEKNTCWILSHICGIYKICTDELICKVEIETQIKRTNLWTPRGPEGMGWIGRLGLHMYTTMSKRANQWEPTKNLLYITYSIELHK